MNNITRTLGAAVAALVVSASVSFADTNSSAASGSSASTASSSAKPAKMATMKKSEHHASVKSEASKSCSAQADAKNLHGKERREFRRSCLKTAQLSTPAVKSEQAKKSASIAPAKPAANSSPASH